MTLTNSVDPVVHLRTISLSKTLPSNVVPFMTSPEAEPTIPNQTNSNENKSINTSASKEKNEKKCQIVKRSYTATTNMGSEGLLVEASDGLRHLGCKCASGFLIEAIPAPLAPRMKPHIHRPGTPRRLEHRACRSGRC